MVDVSLRDDTVAVVPPALTARRLLFTAAVLASMAGLLWLAVTALSAGGFG